MHVSRAPPAASIPSDPEPADRLCRRVLPLFEAGSDYAERAVNALLLLATDDHAGLPRALVDRGAGVACQT